MASSSTTTRTDAPRPAAFPPNGAGRPDSLKGPHVANKPTDRREFVRITVDLPTHPKLAELDDMPAAGWLYVVGVCYAGQHLTDGELPRAAVIRMAGSDRDTAAELVAVGMWHEHGHDCDRCPQPSAPGRVVVHDYLTHQRSKADAEAKREAARKAIEARWAKHRARKEAAQNGASGAANAAAEHPSTPPQQPPVDTARDTDRISGRSTERNTEVEGEEEGEEEQMPNGICSRAVARNPGGRRTRGTTTHAELASSAVKPSAYQLVSQWRQQYSNAPAYPPQTITELSKVVDQLLAIGAPPDLVRTALDEWEARTDVHSPNALRWLYADAVKAARGTRSGRQEPRSARGDKVRAYLGIERDHSPQEAAQAAAAIGDPINPDLDAIFGGPTMKELTA
ncbi:hypothetical protein AB0L13_16755 [Saccharopolyspora shandongensis]|uniref:hypothetical protein n=1 Tax=Saccharopolyspora shandongensis TaxID=418495 RepID=UPI00342B09C3